MATNLNPQAAEVASLVEEAVERLAGVATRTPLERNERLSALVGGEVWLKREDLQPVRSYKLRGAYNLMAQLDDAANGVVCASAGNHAQGVAYACAALEIKGRIFLPRTTPRQKRERIAAIGGPWVDIVIDGDTYDDAVAIAAASALETGARIVPAFDDLQTIAGQGTPKSREPASIRSARPAGTVNCGSSTSATSKAANGRRRKSSVPARLWPESGSGSSSCR